MMTKHALVTDNYVKGLYAVRVSGRIKPELQESLQARGIIYRPRDLQE